MSVLHYKSIASMFATVYKKTGVTLVLLSVIFPVGALAQQDATVVKTRQQAVDRMESFLQDNSRLQTANQLSQWSEKQSATVANALSSTKQSRSLSARIQTLELAMVGYEANELSALKAEGIDLLSITSKHPLSLEPPEKAALSEVAVVATVKKVRNTLEPKDGFRSSVILEVEEVLRGDVPQDRITLRRVTGPGPKGGLRRSSEFSGQVGETHVFFLSNAFYRLSLEDPSASMASVEVSASSEKLDTHFTSLYSALPVHGSRAVSPEQITEIAALGEQISSIQK